MILHSGELHDRKTQKKFFLIIYQSVKFCKQNISFYFEIYSMLISHK